MSKERAWITQQRPEIKQLGERTHLDLDRPLDLTAEQKLLRFIRGDPNITGKSYAWNRTAMTVAGDEIIGAYENTRGPFVALDLCSAFPLWPQTIREMYRERCFIEGTRIAEDAILETVSSSGLSDRFRASVLDLFSEPDGAPRRLVHHMSGLTLSGIINSEEDRRDGDERAIKEAFLYGFSELLMIGTNVITRKTRSEWAFMQKMMQEFKTMYTIEEFLEPLADRETREAFMEDLAGTLARKCLPKIEGINVLSMDMRDPDEILADAKKSFPEDLQYTKFYGHAEQLRGHIQADAFSIPLLNNSVSLITSIEGYPVDFGGFPLQDREFGHLKLAQSVMDKLKPGGRAVFFPWMTVENTREDIHILKEVRDFWNIRGMQTRLKYFDRDYLEERMGDRERMLMYVSPIFDRARPISRYSALVLEKPKV